MKCWRKLSVPKKMGMIMEFVLGMYYQSHAHQSREWEMSLVTAVMAEVSTGEETFEMIMGVEANPPYIKFCFLTENVVVTVFERESIREAFLRQYNRTLAELDFEPRPGEEYITDKPVFELAKDPCWCCGKHRAVFLNIEVKDYCYGDGLQEGCKYIWSSNQPCQSDGLCGGQDNFPLKESSEHEK